MPRAVLDTTVLVSAFLRRGYTGAAYSVLMASRRSEFDLYLSPGILEETRRALATSERNRERYNYSVSAVTDYCRELVHLATIVTEIPKISIVRDPTDDAILGAAIAAHAEFLVSRDKDLLVIEQYENIRIVDPETFLAILATQ